MRRGPRRTANDSIQDSGGSQPPGHTSTTSYSVYFPVVEYLDQSGKQVSICGLAEARKLVIADIAISVFSLFPTVINSIFE